MSERTLATDEQIAAARDLYQDDDINIDDGAAVSEADEGYWVQAWVWVRDADDEDGEEEETE